MPKSSSCCGTLTDEPLGVHDDRIEAWHDRIRETVVKAMDADRARELHERLADGLKPGGDLDVVAWHLGAAGLVERAADATLEAARRAVAQLNLSSCVPHSSFARVP